MCRDALKATPLMQASAFETETKLVLRLIPSRLLLGQKPVDGSKFKN